MKIKNYIVTMITFVLFGIIAYFFTSIRDDWDTGLWFTLTGIFNTIAFIVFMVYNPMYSDMGKPKRVLSGNKMIENSNKHRFDYSKSSGDNFVDSSGFGINPPNLLGLLLGIIFILISRIL